MGIGYDPFKWADVYQTEEEYLKELEQEENKNESEVNECQQN